MLRFQIGDYLHTQDGMLESELLKQEGTLVPFSNLFLLQIRKPICRTLMSS